jgi:hypothetical protein
MGLRSWRALETVNYDNAAHFTSELHVTGIRRLLRTVGAPSALGPNSERINDGRM